MRLFELTELIEKINGNIFTRWNFLLIAILAIVGGLISLKKKEIPCKDSICLLLAFIVFVVANGIGIHKSAKAIEILEKERKIHIEKNQKYEVGKGLIYTNEFSNYLMDESAIFKIWYCFYYGISVLIIVFILFRTDW